MDEALNEVPETPTTLELVKFQVALQLEDGGCLNLICMEFTNQYMIFLTDSPVIGTLIEASPDDLVDLGTPTTYSTNTVFGLEVLMVQLLARRLVEVLQKRILLAVSSHSFTMETIRQIEAEVTRLLGKTTSLNGGQFEIAGGHVTTRFEEGSQLSSSGPLLGFL